MKLILVPVVIVATLLGSAHATLAAQPNNQACLGQDFSGYAQQGADFGHFVAGLAQNGTSGVGTEVQAHLAGEVPDSVIANSCND